MNHPAAAAAVAILAATAAADDIRMSSSALEIPTNPVAIAALDFNSDGRDEVFLFYQYPARYLILQPDQNARLVPTQTVTFAPASIERVSVSDVNNDGRPDIVAFSQAKKVYHILLNQGDGTLVPAQDSPVPAVNWAPTFFLRDTNGDGLPELVTLNDFNIGQAAVYPNLGNGRFAAPSLFFHGSLGGTHDLAVANTRDNNAGAIGILGGQRLRIYHRTGPGPADFALFQDVPVPGGRTFVRSAHLGSQGRESFVVGSFNTAVVPFVVGYDDTTGNYVAQPSADTSAIQDNTNLILSSAKQGPRRAVYSFTGTGVLRVLTSSNQGIGQFVQSTPAPGAFLNLRHITFADLRGDGNEHVVAASTNQLITADPGPDADFAQAGLYEPIAYTPNQLVPFPSRPGAYLAAVNASTELRVIQAEQGPSGYRIYTEAARNVLGATNRPRWAVADINADGRDDILHILSTSQNNRVRWQLQQPNGDYSDPAEMFVSSTAISNLVTADLNNDSFADAIVLQANGDARVLYGQADGQLSQPQTVPLSPLANPGSLIIADLDQDGMLDLVCANRSGSTGTAAFQVAYATGPTSYAPPVAFSALTQAGSTTGGLIDTGDLNADGILDIVVATSSQGPFVLLSDGARSYQSPLLIPGIGNSTSVRIMDMDADGLAELVFSYGERSVIVSRQNEDLFANRAEFLHAGPSAQVVLTDLNADSLPDALVTANNGACLVINRSAPTCIADYLPDGVLDFFDIVAFLTDFNNQVPATDLNNDGVFNFFDIAGFILAFTTNCR